MTDFKPGESDSRDSLDSWFKKTIAAIGRTKDIIEVQWKKKNLKLYRLQYPRS